MANENDPNPIDAPEPESTPEPEGAQESRPSDRRDFLRRLATMSFLTAAVLRGAMPAPAAQDDAVCGSIQTGQIVHKDVDCVGSTVESGTQDLDCGLFNGQEWARHKDNDCLSNTLAEDPGAGTYKDNDCGKSSGGTSPFYTSHSDNACQPATSVNPASPADFDCGLLTGTWGCHYDADCQPFMGQIQLGDNDCALLTDSTDSRHTDDDCKPATYDADCGLAAGYSTAHTDEDCPIVQSTGALYHDADCGLGTIISYSDDDCRSLQSGEYSHDADCAMTFPSHSVAADNACNVPQGGGPSFDADCGLSTVPAGSSGTGEPARHPDNDCHVPHGGGPSTDNAAP